MLYTIKLEAFRFLNRLRIFSILLVPIPFQHKLRESNNNTKKRMALLQSDFEATKSRLEMLMHRQPAVSPDYNAYQIMRRVSRTTMARKISQQLNE